MKVIGIVGGIASGKTTVAKVLKKKGAGYINADEIGHDVIEISEIKQQMEMRWEGSGYGSLSDINGKTRRDIVANIVFNNPDELKFLNAICHPVIETRIEEKLEYFHPEYTKAVILDVPLLLEAGWNEMCDIILFIDTSFDARSHRAHKRSGLDVAELHKRESCQFNLEMKKEFATHTIDNDGTEGSLVNKVDHFWSEIDD